MNRLTSSRIGNAAKSKYIKDGKKKSVLKKLGSRVRSSQLNKLSKEYLPEDELPETNEFILQLSDMSQDDSSSDSETDEDVESITPKRKSKSKLLKRPKTTGDRNQMELLEIQKEIESLRLQQIKQSKKASKIQKEVIETKQKPKPKNPSVESLKQKILVEF